MSSNRPQAEVLRFGQVRKWLMGVGFSENQVDKWIENRVIKPKKIKGCVRAWYETAQIEKEIFNAN